MISLTLFIKISTKNWYPNDEKIWLSTLLKFYAYVMVVILTIMGLVVGGSLWKNQQAEADRIAQRVLTEVVTDLETSYQRVTQEGRSLVENPKVRRVYRYFTLSPSEYETWRLNAQFPSYIQLSLHKNIDSLYLSNKNIEGIDVTLSDYKTVFVSTWQSKLGKQVSADHYKAPATAIPVPFDRSDYGCWSWDRLYDAGPGNFDGSN